MTTPVKDLKGATDSIVSALKDKGITDNEKLVAAGADPAGRKELVMTNYGLVCSLDEYSISSGQEGMT